jgi:uncharacterized membrane protein YoaT (DUF817 family)
MHPRYAPYLFGFLLSGLMCFLVSAIATFRSVGLVPNFVELWVSGWLSSWVVAFPVVLVVAPLTRRIVNSVTRSP